jgi:hypothetical protein
LGLSPASFVIIDILMFMRGKQDTHPEAVSRLQEAGVLDLDASAETKKFAVRVYEAGRGVPSKIVGGPIADETSIPDLTTTPEGQAVLERLERRVQDRLRALHQAENRFE